ncbi:MAG: DUF1501 domain-containing protein [Fimbriimonadaceae bacterium]|nr:MAG: DUF1501 domain-containing protein [Fimbriimonadaceae bacterium]
MSTDLSRRELFAKGGVLAVGLMAPAWLSAIARADVVKMASGRKVAPDNVLVVIQFSGGNDGLNTVIPYLDPEYARLRPTLGIKPDEVLKAADGLGFHPAMAGFAELFKKGQVAVINNVGYPNPNRSHFKSMDIWQSASPDSTLKYGWIGRAFDRNCESGKKMDPVEALGLSTERPLALTAKEASIPCFASLGDIQQMVGDADAERMLREIQGMAAEQGTSVRQIQLANNTALDAISALKTNLGKYSPKESYGEHAFGRGLKQIAQIIATSPSTRVIYLSVGGFDTHARQPESHAALMKGFSDAIAAFQKELEAVGKADKVLTMVFSEFGRRSYENGSQGTDHGKAAPMFLIGKNVKGGFHGPKPDLQNLNDGDLNFKIDFRQAYATALDDWMGNDSKVVLGQQFQSLDVLK